MNRCSTADYNVRLLENCSTGAVFWTTPSEARRGIMSRKSNDGDWYCAQVEGGANINMNRCSTPYCIGPGEVAPCTPHLDIAVTGGENENTGFFVHRDGPGGSIQGCIDGNS